MLIFSSLLFFFCYLFSIKRQEKYPGQLGDVDSVPLLRHRGRLDQRALLGSFLAANFPLFTIPGLQNCSKHPIHSEKSSLDRRNGHLVVVLHVARVRSDDLHLLLGQGHSESVQERGRGLVRSDVSAPGRGGAGGGGGRGRGRGGGARGGVVVLVGEGYGRLDLSLALERVVEHLALDGAGEVVGRGGGGGGSRGVVLHGRGSGAGGALQEHLNLVFPAESGFEDI